MRDGRSVDRGRGSGSGGFTLVEIGIVLAVVGIIAVTALPSIIGLMPRLKLNSNTTTVANEISLARMRAIAQNVNFSLIYDTSSDSFSIKKGAGGAFGTQNLEGTDLYNVTFPAGTLIATPVGAINLAPGSTGYVYLQTPDTAYRKRVAVEPTGRIQIDYWTGSSWVEE